MAQIVSRNTIKLANTASAVNGYYDGFHIVVTRLQANGKEFKQNFPIIAYDGASRIATIDGLWHPEYIPGDTDTYVIRPKYRDARVTINTAMQTMDYITSNRYGKNLDPIKDLYLPSWLHSARICDTQSDVTVLKENGHPGASVGDVYRWPETGAILWQGKIKSIDGDYYRFTDVIGKLSNKWNSWKYYPAGAYVYHEDRLYQVMAAGIKSVAPTHSSGTINGLIYQADPSLTKVSGVGAGIFALVKNAGNFVQSKNIAGYKISGYSLYDADGVDYWRHLGWDEHSQRYATRHQTNLIVDTSVPLFDNTNSFLEHFGGILRYTAGQYHLEVEEGEGPIPNSEAEPRNISNEHIIGKIRVSDEGIRSAFNSLTVAYPDPANKFEAKNISFFNSDYLKADRNVAKKGNVSIPGMTNYYNARLLADKFLAKSRFGGTVSFTMMPRGQLLLAGKVIQLQHPRYGWIDKKFRIQNLTHNTDTTVDIVAKEYDDKFYVISNISRPPAAALAAEANTRTDINPSGLKATNIDSQDEATGGILLTWNNTSINDPTISTEIFGGPLSSLFLSAHTIHGTSWFQVDSTAGLYVGMPLTSQAATNGLEFNRTYFVDSIVDTSFTVSESADGPPITTFQNGTGLSLRFLTASIVTTVSPPTVSYIDVIPGEGSARVQKYYWIRHKITQV
jgi:hypothetical protein